MAIQTCSTNPPDRTETLLVTAIRCNSCDTLRNFRCTEALGALRSRKTQFDAITVDCEKCHTRISVIISWQKLSTYNITKRPELQSTTTGITDELGLTKRRG